MLPFMSKTNVFKQSKSYRVISSWKEEIPLPNKLLIFLLSKYLICAGKTIKTKWHRVQNKKTVEVNIITLELRDSKKVQICSTVMPLQSYWQMG